MSGGHWQYMSERLRDHGDYAKAVWEALGDCEHAIDWAESGDTIRLSDSVEWHEQFAQAARMQLDRLADPNDEAELDDVIARIAQARALLDRRLSGEEHEVWAASVFRRTGRVVGPRDPRGAEAIVYERLRDLFDAIQGGFNR